MKYFIILGLKFWIFLGISEASFLFLIKYHSYGIRSILNLFSAAIISSIMLGIFYGVSVGIVWRLISLLPKCSAWNLNKILFFFSVMLSFFTILFLGTYVRDRTLSWFHLLHPFTLSYLLVLGVGGLFQCILPYKLFNFLKNKANKILLKTPFSPKINPKIKLSFGLLPILFILVGIFLNIIEDETQIVDSKSLKGYQLSSSIDVDRGHLKEQKEHLPNIIFITVETFRADHVNSYGYKKRQVTKNIDKLAKAGVAFKRNFTQSSWTKPSMGSIFTSLYPQQHGLIEGNALLLNLATTLPKILKKLGYRTYSICPNPHACNSGFGFDKVIKNENILKNTFYITPLFPRFNTISGRVFWHLRFNKLLPLMPFDYSNWWVNAEDINLFIRQNILNSLSEPFFLHVHYNEPHNPYFEHPYKKIQFDIQTKWKLEKTLSRYDEEIGFVDGAIDNLIEILTKHVDAENTLIVLTSDHGEEFLDHSGWGHRKTLFNEVLNVPLIFVYPKELPSGKIIKTNVRSIDIAPTILDILEIKSPNSFEGSSLLPLINGTENENRTVISQLVSRISKYDSIILNDFKFIKASLFKGLIQKKFLFKLDVDLGEKNNVIKAYPKIAKELETKLNKHLLDKVNLDRNREGLEMNEKDKEALRSLGYVN